MEDNQRVEVLVQRILRRLSEGPALFFDLLVELEDAEYRDILLAWGRVRERTPLERDDQGRYVLPGSQRVGSEAVKRETRDY
ncbi:MAG: hypothetical protein HY690_12500 [Chloroflexi bacterium]|nr:hypothetical protein [Chloroflexota bacterium]